MQKAALTDRYIKAVKATASRLEITDLSCRGLTLRVTSHGIKSFTLAAKVRGKFHRITLGQYPNISLAEARSAADEARKALREGKLESIALRPASWTFEELVEDYLQRHARPRMRSFRKEVSYLRRPRAEFGPRDPATLRRKEITDFLTPLADVHRVTANRTQAAISRVLGWAVEHEVVAANVLAGAKRVGGKEKSRDRVLSDTEIKTFWNELQADGSPVAHNIALGLQLALLTAQRIGQIAGLKEGDIEGLDREEGWLYWPADRMKSDHPHDAPLSSLAAKTLKTALSSRVVRDTKFVFPSYRRPHGDNHTALATFSRATKAFCDFAGIAPFTPHDLRRTASTLAARAGIPRDHIDRLTAHVISGVSGVYIRYAYRNEKRAAVNAIESTILSIVKT